MNESRIQEAVRVLTETDEAIIQADIWVGANSVTVRRNDEDRDHGTGIDLTFEEMAEALRRAPKGA